MIKFICSSLAVPFLDVLNLIKIKIFQNLERKAVIIPSEFTKSGLKYPKMALQDSNI